MINIYNILFVAAVSLGSAVFGLYHAWRISRNSQAMTKKKAILKGKNNEKTPRSLQKNLTPRYCRREYFCSFRGSCIQRSETLPHQLRTQVQYSFSFWHHRCTTPSCDKILVHPLTHPDFLLNSSLLPSISVLTFPNNKYRPTC